MRRTTTESGRPTTIGIRPILAGSKSSSTTAETILGSASSSTSRSLQSRWKRTIDDERPPDGDILAGHVLLRCGGSDQDGVHPVLSLGGRPRGEGGDRRHRRPCGPRQCGPLATSLHPRRPGERQDAGTVRTRSSGMGTQTAGRFPCPTESTWCASARRISTATICL